MGKTKDRILQASLELFNEQGLAKVTLRTIAGELGMSQGNLNYHFKKREDIIEALYFSLVESISEKMPQVQGEVNLQLLRDISSSIMFVLAEYRFFMLDFVQIMRENEQISTHFRHLVENRRQQFNLFFKALIANGTMREEELPNEYEHFYTRIQMMGDYWISFAEVVYQVNATEKVNEYINMFFQAVYPYLTEKGKVEFNNLKL